MKPTNNPFVTEYRRQQILVPKGLFPNTHFLKNSDFYNTIGSSTSTSSSSMTKVSTAPRNTSRGCNSTSRMVKHPLRKHHSFHFQPSQTVAGILKQRKTQEKNEGPLIFRPVQNMDSAFKPIKPMPKSPNYTAEALYPPPHRDELNYDLNCTAPAVLPATTMAATSLRRHTSNVECYSNTLPLRSGATEPNNYYTDDEESQSTPSSSSARSNALITSTASKKRGNGNNRIHYKTDLDTISSRNLSNNNCDKPFSNNSKDYMNQTDSMAFSSRYKQTPKVVNNNCVTKRTTPYSTLMFNELNI